MSEWKKFKVGSAPQGSFFNPECSRLDTVGHASHVSSAINIIEAGAIRPALVFDESKLNNKRILVCWLSPNHWSEGYRYGNVRFDFSFNDLVEGKRFYWVEVINNYTPKACRILITDVNRDSQLTPYDPTLRDGPWWFDSASGKHYYNGTYCLEFMVEAPISLSHLTKLDFVTHHPRMCSIHRSDPKQCAELGHGPNRGQALFLTRAVVSGTNLTPMSDHFGLENGNPTTSLQFAFNDFAFTVTRKVAFKGSLTQDSELGVAVARAIMSAFTHGSIEEARLLCGLFRDEDSFSAVAAMLLAETVGLRKWEKLANP